MKDSRGFMLKMETVNFAPDVCLKIVNERELARKHADHISTKALNQVINMCLIRAGYVPYLGYCMFQAQGSVYSKFRVLYASSSGYCMFPT